MKSIILVLALFITQFSFSQNIIFQNLNSSGGHIYNQNTHVSFTFGQPIVGSVSNENNIITQGFQQNIEIYGCTDDIACNFDSEASYDDGSCFYPDTLFTDITLCGESYQWHGQTYTESGSYVSVDYSNSQFSMNFDGTDDYIRIDDNQSQNFGTSDFSISAWIKTTDNTGTILSKSVGSGQQNPNNNDWYIIHLVSGKLVYEITDGYSAPGDYVQCSSNQSINDGEWHYFTVVFDRDNLGSIYIDGILDNSCDISGYAGDINPNVPIDIGYDQEHISNYFDGQLYNLGIWNEAISFQTLQTNMSCQQLENQESLISLWNLYELAGDSIYDLSENENNGTINGTTLNDDIPEQLCSTLSPQDCNVEVLNLSIEHPTWIYQEITSCEEYFWDDVADGGLLTESGTYYGMQALGGEICHSEYYELNLTIEICGCTDSTALNYDEQATQDDGSCIDLIMGCTDQNALNYNSEANSDDGSCDYCNAEAIINQGLDTIISCEPVQLDLYNSSYASYYWSTSSNDNAGIQNSLNLAIGDTYQGGIIFWLDENGGGLIAAPFDQSNSAKWGCQNTNIIGADGTAIGSGFQNTIDIEAGCTTEGTAADICANLTLDGYDDWFLPSINELNQMRSNIGQGNALGLGNIGDFYSFPSYYWSSTEYSSSRARYKNFGDSYQGYTNKSGNMNVRAIRAFSAPESGNTINPVIVSTSGWNYVTVIDSFGCIDSDSVYVEIGTCGCTDQTAYNYSEDATIDDGSCNYEFLGCIDINACNYDESANTDDGSCTYLEVEYTINNNLCPEDEVGYIFVSPLTGTAPYSYAWSNGGNNSFLMNLSSGEYILNITDASGCEFNDTIVLDEPVSELANIAPEICYVTVDDQTGKNKIVINSIQLESVVGYVLSKEVLTDVYQDIATLDANTLEYIDDNSNPLANSNRYKVRAIDNCFSSTENSDYHETVHLSMNVGLNNTVNLDWDQYEGFDVSQYMIFRGESQNSLEFIQFVSGNVTSFSDQNPPVGTSIYQVRVVAPICTPILSNASANYAQTVDTLKSNIVEHDYIEQNDDLSLNIIINHPSCETCNDGSLIAQPVNGTPPYTIYWNNGIVSNFNFNLTVGTYTVFISDAEGNLISETVNLSAPSIDVYGCKDTEAINYNPDANIDDGSCEYATNPCEIVPTGLFVDNIIHNRVVFNWSAPSAAPSHYMIRYRELGTTSWTVMTAGPVNSNAFTGTSRTRYFMEPGTTYQWNIRARVLNEDGSTKCQSPWSASNEYTTLAECANLENLSASTEANWVTLSADAPDASWGVWQSKGKLREVGTSSFRYLNGDSNGNISVLKGNFDASTDYEWHTKAWCTGNVDDNGDSDPMYHSGWGDFSYFTSEDPCDKLPTNLTTQGLTQMITNILTMNWDTPESGEPDHYFLELNNENTGQTWLWNNIPGNSNSKTKYNLSLGNYSWRIRGACGTNGTSWATAYTQPVYFTLGADRLQNDILGNLEIYPNPSKDVFNVSFYIEKKQDIKVEIINLLGENIVNKSIRNFEGHYLDAFDLSAEANGIYLLKIHTNHGILSNKLTLQ